MSSDSRSKEVITSSTQIEDLEDFEVSNAINVRTLSAKATPEYVAWIDLMGAKSWMAGSIRRAAEMVALIHIAGLKAAQKHNVRIYPVVDGIYLIS